jgi:sialate O-acetylesterase
MKRTFCAGQVLALFFIAFTSVMRADVALAALFTDHAVLQQEKPLPVWGRAEPSEKITVTLGDDSAHTTADRDGRWIVFLKPRSATAEGSDLVAAGKNTVTVHDVVIGEVWLCSGQSNMEYTVASREGWQANNRVLDAEREIANANFPLVRQVRIEQVVSEKPAETVNTSGWQPASPQTVGGFTAVGYFFARSLHQKLGVPVGIINSSWGATQIESWLSPAALASDPAFKVVEDRWQQTLAEYPAEMAKYPPVLAAWEKEDAAAKAAAGNAAKYAEYRAKHPKPRPPRGPGDKWTPAGLFNGMINPLLPYALRGTIWYQGESNAARPNEYERLFAALITSWRAHFGQGDFPFYWVQLPNYRASDDWAGLREAQTKTLRLPRTGQAVTIDIGEAGNIHPPNKQEVGRRLALIAKTETYGLPGDFSGPLFASQTREGRSLRLRFTCASSGLVAHDKPVQSLQIAGADRKFFPATARIDRDTLIVSAPEVKEPVAVRYAWSTAPEANLYNGVGLPAAPFRSDDW